MIDIIYYAHAMVTYNTEREQKELEMLRQHFPEALIYNPNRPYISNHKEPMRACLHIVKDPSITKLAFSFSTFYYLSLGVYVEMTTAKKQGKPLYEIGHDVIKGFSRELKLVKKDKKRKWARAI